MNAQVGSGSRVHPRWWVVLLVIACVIPAGNAGPPQQKAPTALAPFQSWTRILAPAASTEAVVIMQTKDLADPGTLQVPPPFRPMASSAPKPQPARISSDHVTKAISTAGCMLLPGWRLRLTTLSLLAH